MSQRPPSTSQSSSAKPLLLGLTAIFLLIAVFLLKSHKNAPLTDQTKDQAVEDRIIEVPLITPKEVARVLLNSQYQLVDIREKALYQEKHIQASVNIPYSTIENSARLFDKQKQIIIIDERTSAQGKVLTEHLINEGLRVQYMEGGLEQYLMESLPTISFGNPESLLDQAKATALSATELTQRTRNKELFRFIDVRSKADFDRSHIEGALNIPLEEIEQRKQEVPLGKVITCDDNPVRSFQAAVKLHDMNFWGVFYLSDSLTKLKEVVSAAPATPQNNPGPTSNTPAASNNTAKPANGSTTNTPPNTPTAP